MITHKHATAPTPIQARVKLVSLHAGTTPRPIPSSAQEAVAAPTPRRGGHLTYTVR